MKSTNTIDLAELKALIIELEATRVCMRQAIDALEGAYLFLKNKHDQAIAQSDSFFNGPGPDMIPTGLSVPDNERTNP